MSKTKIIKYTKTFFLIWKDGYFTNMTYLSSLYYLLNLIIVMNKNYAILLQVIN